MPRKKGRRRSPFKFKLKKDTIYSLVSLLLWFIGASIIISFSGQGVILGKMQTTLQNTFGLTTLILPFIFILAGLMLSQVGWRTAKPNVFFGSIIFFFGVLGFFKAGTAGDQIFTNFAVLLQPIGAMTLLVFITLAGTFIMTEASLDQILTKIRNFMGKFAVLFRLPGHSGSKLAFDNMPRQIKFHESQVEEEEEMASEPHSSHQPAAAGIKPNVSTQIATVPVAANTMPLTATTAPQLNQNNPNQHKVWRSPPLDLLNTSHGGKADRGDMNANARTIEDTLDSFGIVKAKVVEVNQGPAVTQYCLQIPMGTKLSKITALQNDLALNLAAPNGQIRIEAPIPGRSLVGVEIPNHSPQFVTLRGMLASKAMKQTKSKLAVALGLNVSGQPVIADIAAMPHLLIAGATGSGKSVCLNAFLATILFRASPEDVKMILVDPKRVELIGYNGIPHLLSPVIVEPDKVLAALKWAVSEMKSRYKIFSEVGVRNIAGYNELSGFQALPYILIVIDELADIMLFAPKEVEEAITKIAQMARATGIHLVLATQRPSVDIITGLIKANVPCRIAFNVASMVDSRVIIDSPGAEKLLGRGDMLYVSPTQSKPSRIQGAYVSDHEINGLIDFIKSSGFEPAYTDAVTTQFQANTVTTSTGLSLEGVDPLFVEAANIVIQARKGSSSHLQRKLSIGYARAARIMDQLTSHGIISGSDGTSKPREVLVKSLEDITGQITNQNI
jgi:S-DNA-T family DNA segregation ATPase FtsK/SpoIIIE